MKIGWVLLTFAAAFAGNLQAATIHEVIDQGDSTAVAAMLDENPALLSERLQNGRTPLHTAAYGGKLNIVQLLVSRGADVNATTPLGAAPLHGSALAGHEAVVEFLVAKGANVNSANRYGYTPLYNATSNGSIPTMKCLIDAGARIEPLTDSAQAPLHSAILRCWPEGVRYLLDAGANANVATGDHGDAVSLTVLTTAWRLSGNENAPAILKLLFEHGATATWRFSGGYTALMHAAGTDDTVILGILLDAGADPNAVSDNGATAFGAAVGSNNVNAARYLINRKAYRLEAEATTGRIPLHHAVMGGSLPMVEAVLSVTPDPNTIDSLDFTPLDMALRYGHKKVAEYLKTKGAVAKGQMKAHLSSSYLAEKPAAGEAYLWYLGNCGYLIKTRDHCLIFDYMTGGMKATEPSITNGVINPQELASENVTVFATHEHGDHFDSTIFGWPATIPGLDYVFGFQPESLAVERRQGYAGQPYSYVGPGMTKTVDGMKIFAVRSNDAGVGFVVEVDGVTIYHAGDLAGWLPDQRNGFIAQIDSIDAIYDAVDVALVNVTGCHHQDTIALAEGTAYTLEKLQPRLVIPTHGYMRENYYRHFMNKFADQFPSAKSFCPMWRGDVAKFTGGKKPAQFEVL